MFHQGSACSKQWNAKIWKTEENNRKTYFNIHINFNDQKNLNLA